MYPQIPWDPQGTIWEPLLYAISNTPVNKPYHLIVGNHHHIFCSMLHNLTENNAEQTTTCGYMSSNQITAFKILMLWVKYRTA